MHDRRNQDRRSQDRGKRATAVVLAVLTLIVMAGTAFGDRGGRGGEPERPDPDRTTEVGRGGEPDASVPGPPTTGPAAIDEPAVVTADVATRSLVKHGPGGATSRATLTLPGLNPSRPTFDDPLVQDVADCIGAGAGSTLATLLSAPGATRDNSWLEQLETSGVGTCLRGYLTALVHTTLAPRLGPDAGSASFTLARFDATLDGVVLLAGDIVVAYDGGAVTITFASASGSELLHRFGAFTSFPAPFPTNVLRLLFDRADAAAAALLDPNATTTTIAGPTTTAPWGPEPAPTTTAPPTTEPEPEPEPQPTTTALPTTTGPPTTVAPPDHEADHWPAAA